MPRTLGDSAKHTLAANLTAVRERVKLSQGEAARRAGLPEIAEAAMSDCTRSFTAYQAALTAWFANISQASLREVRYRSDARAVETQDAARRAIISRVLRTRDGTL